MNIGTVCTRRVVTCDPEVSALDAATLMREYHVGSLVVASSHGGVAVPKGLLTDRDLVVEVMAKELDPSTIRAGEIMSRNLVALSESDDLQKAIATMRDAGVRRLPVVDAAGALVGIITQDDLASALVAQLNELSLVWIIQPGNERRQRG
jgi:CBS domain-containing protein